MNDPNGFNLCLLPCDEYYYIFIILKNYCISIFHVLIQKKKKKETNSYLKTIYLLHKSDIGNENSHIAFLIYIFDAYTIIEMKL